MSALLDAWLTKVKREEVEDAVDELDYALEELSGLARGDRHPGSPGALAMEISDEYDRAQTALARLRRYLPELLDGVA